MSNTTNTAVIAATNELDDPRHVHGVSGKHDRTIEGGAYWVGNKLVNANGTPIDVTGKMIGPPSDPQERALYMKNLEIEKLKAQIAALSTSTPVEETPTDTVTGYPETADPNSPAFPASEDAEELVS